MGMVINFLAVAFWLAAFGCWILAASLQVYFNDPKSEYADSRAEKAITLCCQFGIPAVVLTILGALMP
jgi:hypothetical protein